LLFNRLITGLPGWVNLTTGPLPNNLPKVGLSKTNRQPSPERLIHPVTNSRPALMGLSSYQGGKFHRLRRIKETRKEPLQGGG